MGIVIVPLDATKLSSERPSKPRKPKAERPAIPARKDLWPKGRKLQSANALRKSERTPV
jgi:hypothetical protein